MGFLTLYLSINILLELSPQIYLIGVMDFDRPLRFSPRFIYRVLVNLFACIDTPDITLTTLVAITPLFQHSLQDLINYRIGALGPHSSETNKLSRPVLEEVEVIALGRQVSAFVFFLLCTRCNTPFYDFIFYSCARGYNTFNRNDSFIVIVNRATYCYDYHFAD